MVILTYSYNFRIMQAQIQPVRDCKTIARQSFNRYLYFITSNILNFVLWCIGDINFSILFTDITLYVLKVNLCLIPLFLYSFTPQGAMNLNWTLTTTVNTTPITTQVLLSRLTQTTSTKTSLTTVTPTTHTTTTAHYNLRKR